MEISSLDEIDQYHEITSPGDVEDEEMLNRVLQEGKGNCKKKEKEEVQGMKRDVQKDLVNIQYNPKNNLEINPQKVKNTKKVLIVGDLFD